MIETPVNPNPSGIDAPPPDATLRQAVPAPPPDAAARHERACEHCGSPLHSDQLSCLVCGRMASDARGRVPWRTWGLTSAATLLLVGGTVGAAVAGLPNGKHVKNPGPIANALAPKKPIPPATAQGTPGGGGSTTPLPGTGGGAATPPSLHTPKVHPSTTPKASPSTPSTTGGGGGGSSNPSSGGSGTKKKKHKHKTTTPGASSQLFANGVAPDDAQLFDPSGDGKDHPSDVINTIDNNTATTWSTRDYPNGLGKDGVGIWVKAPSGSDYAGVGLFSRRPGYNVEIRYTTASSPPQQPSAWTVAAKQSSASGRQRISFKGAARKATYYLVWITKLPNGGVASLSEIQLLQ
jgi:hypothetical protein